MQDPLLAHLYVLRLPWSTGAVLIGLTLIVAAIVVTVVNRRR